MCTVGVSTDGHGRAALAVSRLDARRRVERADDPDSWPLVLADELYEHWEQFDGSLCEFLTELALGRFDASRFRDDYEWQGQRWIDIPSRPVFFKRPV